MRSVYTGLFKIGAIKMPISIYKACEPFSLDGQRYHEGCGGKVRSPQRCEVHPDDEEIVTYTGFPIGDTIVPISSEVRNTLLDRKMEVEFVGFVKETALRDLMPHSFIPYDNYRVVSANSIGTKIEIPAMFPLFLERMRVKKVFALIKVSPSGMRRYAILHHTGVMTTLMYAEEVREFPEMTLYRDKETSAYFDQFIEDNKTSMIPAFSMRHYIKRVEKWIEKSMSKVKSTKRKVKVNA